MKKKLIGISLLFSLEILTGCAPMQASVPQQTADIGGMHSTYNNPIENPRATPIENANRMISY